LALCQQVKRFQLIHVFDELIDSYVDRKIGVALNFLPSDFTQELRDHLIYLIDENKLRLAKIGNSNGITLDTTIRNDAIYWLDRKHEDATENKFLDFIEEFVQYLNRTCFTGITSYEFHYAHFEKGHFYKKHLDQFQNNNQRQYSMICYLNEYWDENDGGELCVYKGEEKELISPTNGKCVFFKSDELEHEVLPTQTSRLSVTGWFKVNELVV
jgi:SM-20-related protein